MLLHDHVLENGEASPYAAYRVLSTAFQVGLVGLTGATALLRRFKTPLSTADLLTLGLATHKISAIVTKERVTLPLRAPFTTQADHGPAAGHESVPRGHGMQRALGELLTCPHCTAPWVALGLIAGHVVAPLPTRAITTLFSTVALAGAFHHAYAWLEAQQTQAKKRATIVEEERQNRSSTHAASHANTPSA
jgi:hypothetical protein